MTDLLPTLLASLGFDMDGLDGEAWYADEIAVYLSADGQTAELGDALGRSAGSLPTAEAVAFFRSADLSNVTDAFRTWEALAA